MSLRSNSLRHSPIAGFFFQGLASAAGPADAAGIELETVSAQQLQAAAADGGGVQAQALGHAPVSAAAELQRLEAGIQAPRTLVEQVEEARACCLELSGRILAVSGRRGRAADSLAAAQLLPGPVGVGMAVQRAAIEAHADQFPQLDEPAQGGLGGDAELGIELAGCAAVGGIGGEGLDGVEQRAAPGEAGGAMGPQAAGVEVGGLAQGVEAAAMGIGVEVVEGGELAQDGVAGGGAESGHELGHGGHLLALQEGDKRLGLEGGRAHSDTCIPPARSTCSRAKPHIRSQNGDAKRQGPQQAALKCQFRGSSRDILIHVYHISTVYFCASP